MPITIYQPHVDRAGVPGFRQDLKNRTAEATAGIAEGATKLAGAAEEIKQNEEKRQSMAVAMDAYAKLNDTDLQLRDAVGALRGGQVKESVDENGQPRSQIESVEQNYDANVESIRQSIKDQRALETFNKQATAHRASFKEFVNQHVATQMDVAAKDSAEGAAASATQSASTFARNIAEFEAQAATATTPQDRASAMWSAEYNRRLMNESLDQGKNAVIAYHAGKGADPTVPLLKQTTDANVSVVQAMLDSGNTKGAKDFFDEHRAEIDTGVQSKVDEVLRAATSREESRSLADQAWAESMRDESGKVVSSGGDPSRAINALLSKGVKNPGVLDDAVKIVRQRGAELAQARRESDSPMIGRIGQRLLSPGIGFNPETDPDFPKLSDEGKYDALKMLAAEQRSRRTGRDKARQIQNQLNALAMSDFRRTAATTPGDALAVDVDHSYTNADQTTRNLIRERQGKLGDFLQKSRGVTRQNASTMAIEAAQKAGLGGVVGGKVQRGSQAEEFVTYLTEWYADAFTENGGKPPQDKDVQKAIKDGLLSGSVPKLFNLYRGDAYQFEAGAGNPDFSTLGYDEQNKLLLQKLDQSTTSAVSPQKSSGGRVRVRLPDGRTANLPAAQVDALIKTVPGAQVVQ